MEAADFINKTLQRKPSNRLGLNGPEEIKSHIWLKDVDWQAIEEKKFESPFKPDIRPPLTNPKIEKETPEQLEENSQMLRRNSI
jgi:serum/glucocorticoid-regulated kinase 1/serum/glucocorticoid-regulated kinase 2